MMVFPTELDVTNVGPYAGSHHLDLVDDVYAVVAQHQDNPERSNWLGKSTLLWCIPYALFGEHPATTDNDWVTRGEAYAEVKLTLSDGTVIRRTKPRDKTAQLSVKLPGAAELLQGAAQDALAKHIGLTRDEFMSVCFYAQKQLARLVASNSSGRIDIVEGWIAKELEPLQNMHANAVLDLGGCMTRLETLKSKHDAIKLSVQAMVQRRGYSAGTDVVSSLAQLVSDTASELALAQGTLTTARERRLAAEQWAAQVEVAEEFEAITAKGQQLRLQYDAIPVDIDAKRERFKDIRDRLLPKAIEADALHKQALQAGAKFDGTCPINCARCPSESWVKANPISAKVVKERELTAKTLLSELDAKNKEVFEFEQQARQRVILDAKLGELREQAETMVDTANMVAQAIDPPDLEELDTNITAAEHDVQSAQLAHHQALADQKLYDDAWQQVQLIDAEDTAVRARRVMLAEAVQLLGRTGLQQKLGELALAEVEVGANAMLLSAGIPLTVSVAWSVQHQGLAKHCDKCGTAYTTTSARVKQCTRCGANRGANTTAKLVIELSNRSGAAEDLAGIAVGLSASVWLRSRRSSSWGSVCIDEPFGALDQHNKKALSVHVATLLKQSFSSAFIVAHDREILDALPQRVTIQGSDNGSTFAP